MKQRYTAVITEVKMAGADAVIAAVMPHPSDDKQVAMNIAGLVSREDGMKLTIGTEVEVTISTIEKAYPMPSEPEIPKARTRANEPYENGHGPRFREE